MKISQAAKKPKKVRQTLKRFPLNFLPRTLIFRQDSKILPNVVTLAVAYNNNNNNNDASIMCALIATITTSTTTAATPYKSIMYIECNNNDSF